jgi:hypothetical protein
MACVVGQNVNSNDSSLHSGKMGIPMVTGHKVNNDSGFLVEYLWATGQ